MRWIMALCIACGSLTATYAQAASNCEGKPLYSCIQASNLELSLDEVRAIKVAPLRYSNGFDKETIRQKRWFKPVVIAYWVGAAIDSYNDDDEFRFKTRMLQERTVSASFDIGSTGSRLIFDPRKSLVFFPHGRNKKTDHLCAVHITSRGAVLSFAINLGHFRLKHN